MLTLVIMSNLYPASLLSGHTRIRQWGTLLVSFLHLIVPTSYMFLLSPSEPSY